MCIAIENLVDRDIECRLEQLTFHIGFGHRDPLSSDAERDKRSVKRGVSFLTDGDLVLAITALDACHVASPVWPMRGKTKTGIG